ncbi:hypothetical protein HK100_006315 [Physocladia obscura]|uniref:Uncharacterized protein n=1 Tax=Physocladia obscura TaxID=109957 RepID=A0AAD5SQL5_9FUNG|nr:hypothetical protein HK100_006315 [Physocladia obscura]
MKQWFREKSIERNREETRKQEQRAEEDVKIEANRLRRERQLAQIENERAAGARLAAQEQQTVFLKAQSEIARKKHELDLESQKRSGQLYWEQQDAKDAQLDRDRKRELDAIALREARRQEELRTATSKITVKENLITENGKVVGATKEILRVRQATTDAEVDALMASIAGELALVNPTELTLPKSIGGASEQRLIKDDGDMFYIMFENFTEESLEKMANLTGTAITTPSSHSALCVIRISACDPYNTTATKFDNTTNYAFTYCSNSTSLTNNFYLPPDASFAQANIPAGLICNDTVTSCDRYYSAYACLCYEDGYVDDACTADAFNTSPPGVWAQIMGSTLYKALFIVGCVIVGLIILFNFGRWSFRKYGEFEENLRLKKIKRAQQKEEDANRDVQIQENNLRRQQKLDSTRNEAEAARALEKERIRLAHEVEMDRINNERHVLILSEIKRKEELVTVVESSKDEATRREANRELQAIELRAAKRQEELAASGSNIEVTENLMIENGKLVGATKNIVRKRIAKTEEEAGQLLSAVAPELQKIQQEHEEQKAAAAIQDSQQLQIDNGML